MESRMIIPFKDEATIDIDWQNRAIERLYDKPHFRYHQENAKAQLCNYIHTGRLPFDALSNVIGCANVGLKHALSLVTNYQRTHYENSLHRLEAVLIQTHFSDSESENGYQFHSHSSYYQAQERIPYRYSLLASQVRPESTESGFHIGIRFKNSVCLQPDWSAKQCRDTIIMALEQKISQNVDRNYFTNDSLELRCIDLDVFSIGNPNLPVISDLSGNLPDYLTVKDIQYHYHGNEWCQPNVRYTVEHCTKATELYISIYPVPMKRIEQILSDQCHQLLNLLNQLPELHSKTVRSEFNILKDGVKAVLQNLDDCEDTLNEVSSALWAYNKQRDFLNAFKNRTSYSISKHDIYTKSLVQMHGIIRAYNTYRLTTLKKRVLAEFYKPQTTIVNNVDNLMEVSSSLLQFSATTIEELLLEGITAFKTRKDNWLVKNPEKPTELTFRKETELTKILRSYLYRSNVMTSLEDDRGVGRSDLEITFYNSQIVQRAIVENKRITEDTDADIVDKYCSALHQIEHYLENNNADGYILFFVCLKDLAQVETLLLNCDDKLQRVDNPNNRHGFNLIHDDKYKVKLIKLPLNAPTKTYKKSILSRTIKESFNASKNSTK